MFVDACAIIYIMQIHFLMFAEVKVLQQQNMLNVHYIHTLVCMVYKWNYEHYLYGHTFISTDTCIRFARTNASLI